MAKYGPSLLIGVLLIFVFPLCVVVGAPSPAHPVQVDKAVMIEISPFVWVNGTVIGRYDARVAAEIDGNLTDILDIGDHVKAGDVIARIDDTSYRLALNEVKAEILPVESMLAFYQRETARLEKLAEQNNVAKNRLDQTRASRDESIARIHAIKARMATVQDELDKTMIQAPFDGIVTERLSQPGERVGAGDQVVRLTNVERLEIQARIRQNYFPFIKPNDVLVVKSGTEEIQGRVRTVIPVGDDISRLYEIRVEFKQTDWLVGEAVKLAIPTEKKQTVLAVSRDALVIRKDGLVIYRVNEQNTAELIPVKTGISNTTHIQIIGNVKENDNVVVRGNERLQPGQKVNVISNTGLP